MKTDELIALLAADTGPHGHRGAARQIATAVVAGMALAAATMLLTLGPRIDLGQAISWPMFWMKVLFPTMVAVASFATLTRLARPGVVVRAGALVMVAPVLLLWLVALLAYVAAPPQQRTDMVWGQTWQVCTLNIALISVPIFAAAFFALRQLAPTQPAQAGACAGALSGAASAAIYAFHCPETALPFMAIWYVAGMALPAGIGAWLGPRALRW